MAGHADPLENVINIDGTQFTIVELDKANKKRITQAAKDRFVMLLREGLDPASAAKQLGLTASRMKGEAKRDEKFGEAVAAARKKGAEMVEDRVRTVYHRRALDPDGPPMLLHNLALAHLPEFAVLRKVQLEGDLRALPTIDPALYSDEELVTLHQLLRRREKPELPPGEEGERAGSQSPNMTD